MFAQQHLCLFGRHLIAVQIAAEGRAGSVRRVILHAATAPRGGRHPTCPVPAPIGSRGQTPEAPPWLWHDVMDAKLALMAFRGIDVRCLRQVRTGSASLLLEAVRQGLAPKGPGHPGRSPLVDWIGTLI